MTTPRAAQHGDGGDGPRRDGLKRNKWCALANSREALSRPGHEVDAMQTLLLPERCEQQGVQQLQRPAKIMVSGPDETPEPYGANCRLKREAMRVSFPVRDDTPRKYRHWGINE
jgi:hypothetical protein